MNYKILLCVSTEIKSSKSSSQTLMLTWGVQFVHNETTALFLLVPSKLFPIIYIRKQQNFNNIICFEKVNSVLSLCGNKHGPMESFFSVLKTKITHIFVSTHKAMPSIRSCWLYFSRLHQIHKDINIKSMKESRTNIVLDNYTRLTWNNYLFIKYHTVYVRLGK